MNTNLLTYIFIIFIIVICLKIYIDSDMFNLKCIISSVDGNRYCVRERAKLEMAADHLANVTNNMNKLVEYCKNEYPTDERIIRLVNGYNPKKIYEILPTSEYTAYSENKGEKLAFCLETEKESGKGYFIDLNTLTYIAIHELSHIASKSIGHGDEFWENFKFLLIQSEKIKIYKPIDYKKNPVKYCGTTIHDNPYFDK